MTIGGQLPVNEGGKQDFKISINDPPPCTTGFLPGAEIRTPGDTTIARPADRLCIAKSRRMIRAWCVARGITRARSSQESAPRLFSCAATRPATSRSATTHGAVRRCRSARRRTSWRTTRQRMGETFCRPTSSRTSHRRTIRTRDIQSRRAYCRLTCRGARGRRRISRGRTSPRRTRDRRRRHTRRGFRRHRIRMRGRRLRSRRAGRPIRPSAGCSPGPTVRRLRPRRRRRPRERHRRRRHLPPAQPQADGASYGTYDQHTGVFVDPAGGTGVYAPGVANMRPQENWLDLMLYPKQV